MSTAEHVTVAHLPGDGHGHPGVRTYLLIGVVLAVITGCEVWVYTLESLKVGLVPILLVLSAVKFFLVVSFYMHLRFDSKIFAAMFGFGLLIAGSVITVLLLLFSVHPASLPRLT